MFTQSDIYYVLQCKGEKGIFSHQSKDRKFCISGWQHWAYNYKTGREMPRNVFCVSEPRESEELLQAAEARERSGARREVSRENTEQCFWRLRNWSRSIGAVTGPGRRRSK